MKDLKKNKYSFRVAIMVLLLVYLVSNPAFDNPFKTDTSESLQDQKINDEAGRMLQTLLAEIETEPVVKKESEKIEPPPESLCYEKSLTLVNAGKKLIGDNRSYIDTPGVFTALAKLGCQFYFSVLPIFIANHWRYFESPEFFSAMARLGCRFYIENQATDKLVAGIDTETGQFAPIGSIQGLSPRKRLISVDSTVEQYLDSTEKTYGQGEYQLIMMVPLKLDYYLIGAMEDAVGNTNHHIKKFVCFYGRYEPFEKGILLNIYKGKVMSSQGIHDIPVYVSLKMSYEDNYATQMP